MEVVSCLEVCEQGRVCSWNFLGTFQEDNSMDVETWLQTLTVPLKDKKGWEFEGPVLFFEANCALRAMRRFGFIGSYFPVFVGGLPPSKLFQAQAICDEYITYLGHMDVCSIDFVRHFQLHCQSNSQNCSSSSSIHVL